MLSTKQNTNLAPRSPHGIKGFIIPTKSFVEIGVTKIFCYNKMFGSTNKTFGCCCKIFGCSNKKNYLLSLILLPQQNHFFRAHQPDSTQLPHTPSFPYIKSTTLVSSSHPSF